ncbi:MAG: hypothetical protein IJD80_01155, partial [Oscillospiraceae bacterium]|nr:hypothetical protein [Oscillospiraceae bacterium]
ENADMADEVYFSALDLYNQYMSLTDAEKKQIPDAAKIFNKLIEYFESYYGDDDSEDENAHYNAIEDTVKQMVDSYAKEVYMDNSASFAIEQLLWQSVLGRKPIVKISKTSPVVAAVFNSGICKAALIDGLTHSIITQQKQNVPEVYAKGQIRYYNYKQSYFIRPYADAEDKYALADAIKDYDYKGEWNRNDSALTYVVGGMVLNIALTEKSVNADKAVYDVTLGIMDVFDFDGNYSGAEKEGFDASFEKYLTGIGSILGGNLLYEFQWELTYDKFTIEVPYVNYKAISCDHESGSYRFEYVAENDTLSVIDNDKFRNNRLIPHLTLTTAGKKRYYCELGHTVKLMHNKP